MLYREDEQFLIDPAEIVYIEASGNRVEVVTSSGTYDSKKSFTSLKNSLIPSPLPRLTRVLW